MQVVPFASLEELEPYAESWERLAAGVPMRGWTWLSHWWRHYGPEGDPRRRRARLMVLAVFDHADSLAGLAPWYSDGFGPGGRVIRWLGGGEICSDYVSILCRPAAEPEVVTALAACLGGSATAAPEERPAWDHIELEGVHPQDRAAHDLVRLLAQQGSAVHERPGPTCWRLELPARWDDYLALLSKGHRKQLRRLERDWFDTGRAVLRGVQRRDDLPPAMDLLIDLHQRRRHSLGQPGCFASARFTAFHRQAAPALLAEGHLQLHWLELDGRPAAVEYMLSGNGVAYCYQSGVDPQALNAEPGRLVTLALVRWAIQQGYKALDFLRGDEPYKAHFRAEPRPTVTLHLSAARPAARLRQNLWLAGRNVKQWLKTP